MNRLISWKITLISFLAAISVILFLFPLAHFEATEILDVKLYYTTEQAYNLINSYSDSDRATYRWFTVSIDILFPSCYGIFYFTLLTLLGRKLFGLNNHLFEKIKFIALGGALFDILENFGIFIMLSLYPKTSNFIGTMSGIFTLLKWTTTSITWILLVGFLISILVKKVLTK